MLHICIHVYTSIFFLATITLASATPAPVTTPPSSFAQWVSEFPLCAWPCLDDLFNNYLSSKCGANAKSSTDPVDVDCICTATDTSLQMGQSANELTTCLSNECAQSRDAAGFERAVGDIIPMCMQAMPKRQSGAAILDVPRNAVVIGIVILSGTFLV